MKNDPLPEALSRKRRLEHFARDAERAREEHRASRLTADENMARLREQRLARDAAEAKAAEKAKPKRRPAATGRKARASKSV